MLSLFSINRGRNTQKKQAVRPAIFFEGGPASLQMPASYEKEIYFKKLLALYKYTITSKYGSSVMEV